LATYQFRLAQPADRAWLDHAVVASAWETLADEQRRIVHPGFVAQQARSQLLQAIGMPGGALLVATWGGLPVGYLFIAVGPDSTTEEPTVHLTDLWVHPSHRRRGVASTLLQVGERMAAAHGLEKVKIWTGLHNRAAVALAEAHGFKPAGLIGVKDL